MLYMNCTTAQQILCLNYISDVMSLLNQVQIELINYFSTFASTYEYKPFLPTLALYYSTLGVI